MLNKYKTDWCTRMDSYGQGSKLRTYKLYKFPYCTEQYLLQNIPTTSPLLGNSNS
jgi:hypothetical protein